MKTKDYSSALIQIDDFYKEFLTRYELEEVLAHKNRKDLIWRQFLTKPILIISIVITSLIATALYFFFRGASWNEPFNYILLIALPVILICLPIDFYRKTKYFLTYFQFAPRVR